MHCQKRTCHYYQQQTSGSLQSHVKERSRLPADFIPRPSSPPVFDCFQYCEQRWGRPGNKTARVVDGMTKLCFHMIVPLVLGRWVGLWPSPSQSPRGCHTWQCRPPTSLCTPAPCPNRKTCLHHSSCHSSRIPHSDCRLLKHKTFHHLHPIPSLVTLPFTT